MERDILTIKQQANKNNVMITNLPKIAKENLKDVIASIGQQVNVDVNTNEIIDIYQNENKKFKTFPIIVKLSNGDFKRKCMEFRKLGNNIDVSKFIPNTNMMGKNVNFYHLLEKDLSELMKKTKQEAINKKYQYVWMRDARILVRKEENSAIIEIDSIEDLKKLK